jgi:hypothetical protein
MRNDGRPGIEIHPRCVYSIQGFAGGWFHPTGKYGDMEWFQDRVAEVHPMIDLFDNFKYFVMHIIEPEKALQRDANEKQDYYEPPVLDEITGVPL